MPMSNTEIAALVGSRICHDLISPVGAIGNGVELLGMSGGMTGPEMALITQSVGNASARIRFFRIAFGLAGDGQIVSEADIRSILTDISTGNRITILWEVEGGVPRPVLRKLFLALLCGETALGHGGTLRIGEDENGWIISATSDRIHLEEGLWNDLATGETTQEIEANRVQFALLPRFLAETGQALSITRNETQVEMRF